MLIQRIRVRFQKKGELRSISHLDLMRTFERALRRTGLPLRMSEGFNPKPRLAFPAPLGVGIEGTDELMEFELAEWAFLPEVERRLKEQLPAGLEVSQVAVGHPRDAAQASEVTYRIIPAPEVRQDARLSEESLRTVMAKEEISCVRLRKGRNKTVNIRPVILGIERTPEGVVLRLKAGPAGSARPEELLGALGFGEESCRSSFRCVRTQVRLAE